MNDKTLIDFTITEEENNNKSYEDDLAATRMEALSFIASRQEELCSEALVKYIRDKFTLYTTRDDIKSEVWAYQDGIYVPNGVTLIKEVVRKVLHHAYTPQRVNKVVSKVEADTYIDADDFFLNSNIDEVPVQNGILNIKTKELTSFTPEKIFFNKLPMNYNSNALCPNIDSFLGNIISKETNINVLYQLIGYCLYRDHPIEKAFMFVGDGRNGKTKLIDLIKIFIGAENTCVVPLDSMQNGNTAVCELYNKMVNIAGDLESTALKQTGLFKDITGRGRIGAKRKYLRDIFFVSYAKNIFACNQLPKVYDTSDGFWERWVLLQFPYKFVPKAVFDSAKAEDKKMYKLMDTDIIEKITTQDELSGLLNKALEALEVLLKKKDFSYSKGTNDIKNTWIRKADSFAAFCMDNIEEDYDAVIIKREMRSRFSKYCRSHKIRSASEIAMKIYLEDNFGAYSSKKEVDGTWENVFEGIKFKDEEVVESKTYATLEKLKAGVGMIEFEDKDLEELEELKSKGLVYDAVSMGGIKLWGLVE